MDNTIENRGKENKNRVYIAIDLKSFYASVECRERGLDPLTTNLVVADKSRTDKTICLAVTPSLKAHGISGRARLFEVVQRVREVNAERRRRADGGRFRGASADALLLEADPDLQLDYIVAPPRMAYYMDYSARIYEIYLKYIAAEDMHVYSIDEVFMDVTDYLATYKMTPHELAMTIIRDVLKTTGITATAGIGTNLYLCKIAMDIVAKHIEADEDGVRIAELDEMSYRRLLWNHRPITDFWRIGRGYSRRLEEKGLFTMGDIARCSLGAPDEFYNEDLLYKMFGVNAELLIDHAWGREPCTIKQIKAYKPSVRSISTGQVLNSPHGYEQAKLIAWEMADAMAMNLLDKGLVTDQFVLTVGYDVENLKNPRMCRGFKGEVKVDHYGRLVPKHAHGTINLKRKTSSSHLITEAIDELFSKIVNPKFSVRRISLAAADVVDEGFVKREADKTEVCEQLDLFVDYAEREKREAEEEAELQKERRMQEAMLNIKKKYGKNAVLRGANYLEGATAKDRNAQIGGHKA